MQHATIQFGKETVTKMSAPNLMRIEVEKNLRAYEISQDCGLFRVPNIVDYDETKGIAVFERIHEMNPIQNIINQTKHYNIYIEQIGRALAVIHQNLKLPKDMIVELPLEFKLPGTEVFIHGDFNGVNVALIPHSPSIVILDWQMTAQHGGQATYGSRYFDIIWFINFFLWNPRIKYLFNNQVIRVAELFIQSYFNEANLPYDAGILAKYSQKFFDAKLPARKKNINWRTRHLLPLSNKLTKNFINSLHAI